MPPSKRARTTNSNALCMSRTNTSSRSQLRAPPRPEGELVEEALTRIRKAHAPGTSSAPKPAHGDYYRCFRAAVQPTLSVAPVFAPSQSVASPAEDSRDHRSPAFPTAPVEDKFDGTSARKSTKRFSQVAIYSRTLDRVPEVHRAVEPTRGITGRFYPGRRNIGWREGSRTSLHRTPQRRAPQEIDLFTSARLPAVCGLRT